MLWTKLRKLFGLGVALHDFARIQPTQNLPKILLRNKLYAAKTVSFKQFWPHIIILTQINL